MGYAGGWIKVPQFFDVLFPKKKQLWTNNRANLLASVLRVQGL